MSIKSKILPVFLLVFTLLTMWCVHSLHQPTFFTDVSGIRKYADMVFMFTLGGVIPAIYLCIDILDRINFTKVPTDTMQREESIALQLMIIRSGYLFTIVLCLMLLLF